MKFSTYLSLMTFGASAVVAAPLFRDNIVAERRHVPAPVVRREASAVASEASASAATAAPAATASAASQAPFEYSTITNTAGFAFSGSTYALSSSVSTSATTETRLPQASASASGNGNVNRNMNEGNNFNNNNNNNFNSGFNSFNNGLNLGNGFNNFDLSNSAVITVTEVQTITQFVAVEVPVFLGVQVNNGFRENLFVNSFSNNFQSRFNQWDINVINQLGFILSQQYEFLSRAGNNGFSLFNNDGFNSFVNKFSNQFNVFNSFNLSDVQQLLVVLQGFNLNQLSSFFGRSDLLFSQDTFNQFGINNNFNSFVSQLPQLIIAVENGAFNNDGIFNLSNLNLNTLNFLQIV